MISIEWKGLEKLIKDLERFRKSALPYAAREYVNNAAFKARSAYMARAQVNMVLRSQHTVRSIQVEKAKGTKLADMQARMGSTEEYMADQEGGKRITAKGKHGEPLPAAAPGARKKRGKVSARNRLAKLQLVKANVSGSRQRKNAVAIGMAVKRGGGVVYLDLRKARGLYRVSGKGRRVRVRKVWDLSKRRVVVPKNPMMDEALKLIESDLPRIAEKALLFQLRRHRILGY